MNKVLKVYIAHQGSMHNLLNKIKEDIIVVAGGYETTTLENGILKLKCDDSYCGLPDKIASICKFVSEAPELAEYTHIHKLDEDLNFIKDFDGELSDYMGEIGYKETVNRNHHIGRCPNHYWNFRPFEGEVGNWCNGDPGYILSRKAFTIIGKLDGTRYPLEDVMVGTELSKHNIHPVQIDIRWCYRLPHYYNNRIKSYKDLKDRVWEGQGIPKWIIRTGNDTLRELHFEIVNIYNKQLEDNPEYELFYFTREDRLQFIEDQNDPQLLTAYNTLIPEAYKADLFRYVILNVYGGVYMDFSMQAVISLDEIIQNRKYVYSKDSASNGGIFNSFICSVSNSPFLSAAIERCIIFIGNKYYGWNSLSITGPDMLGHLYQEMYKVTEVPLGKVGEDTIIYDHRIPNYTIESSPGYNITYVKHPYHYDILYANSERYGNLWDKRMIYKLDRSFIKSFEHIKDRKWEGNDIPKWIFRTGKHEINDLPEEIIYLYRETLDLNPGYELFYFSDRECEESTLYHYGQQYLNFYNMLVPSAFKADFWRYLILNIYGGCYGDFTQKMLVPYDELTYNVDRVFVRDDPSGFKGYLYNAFMCSKANDLSVKRAIDICVYNIEHEYYGNDPLSTTGPAVLGQAFKQVGFNKIKTAFDISVGVYNRNKILINHHNLTRIKEGDREICITKLPFHFGILYKTQKHYGQLYNERNVFKK